METVVRSVATPALNVFYEQTGPDSGEPILLLHGFPYDVRQFDGVRARIAGEGRRLIVPYSRGFGLTRYASDATFRSGQQAALGKDVLDLLDSLEIERATLVGYDWGSRAACVMAAVWPERVRALVAVGGYTIQDIAKAAVTPKAPEQEHQYWYQWYFQTERGRAGLEKNRAELGNLLWRMWSPTWWFEDAYFDQTAVSFDNADFVETVLHSYRHRYGNAPGDRCLEEIEKLLARDPKIAVPTIALHGEADHVDPPVDSAYQESHFTGSYERRILPGIGHCAPAEAPEAVSRAIEDILAA